jgi:hypothetical protein
MTWINDKTTEKKMKALRKPYHLTLAIAFIALNILDASLTSAAIRKGGYELLPIARHILEQPSWVFWLFKVGLALIFALILVILSKKYPQQTKRILTILVGVMIGVCAINLIACF